MILGRPGEREEISGATQVRARSTRRWTMGRCPPESIADADGVSASGLHRGEVIAPAAISALGSRAPRRSSLREGVARNGACAGHSTEQAARSSRSLREYAPKGVHRSWPMGTRPNGQPNVCGAVAGPCRDGARRARLAHPAEWGNPRPPHGWGNQWGRSRGPTLPGFARQHT